MAFIQGSCTKRPHFCQCVCTAVSCSLHIHCFVVTMCAQLQARHWLHAYINCTQAPSNHTQTHNHAHTNIYTQTHTVTPTYCILIHTHFTYSHTLFIRVRTRTHTHTHTETHTHTHTHTHMCTQTPSTGLRHPSFNHCRIQLCHRVQKTVS